jgi:hypothetical protein
MQMVKLLRREEVAEGTMSFYFDKPAGFQFKPGQYVDWTLTNPPETDAEGNIRSLSLASAPGIERRRYPFRRLCWLLKELMSATQSCGDIGAAWSVELTSMCGETIRHDTRMRTNNVTKTLVTDVR